MDSDLPLTPSGGEELCDDDSLVVDWVTDYAEKVAGGEIIAGPHVRGSCARHLRDLVEAPARGYVFDVDLALYYIAFIEQYLCLNGGDFEGRPFLLEPWQKFIVGSLYGWVSKATGYRRFRTAYIEIGKGNGKSPLAAAIGLCGLIIDQEARAEIYAAATKKDQAMILFRDAVAMVDQSPHIARLVGKSGRGEQTWNLSFAPLHSFFRPISSDDGQSGPRPHVALVDEVHEHKDGTVLDMLRRGFKGRTQPLIVEITNSGSDRQSICWEHHEHSVKVLGAKQGDPGFDDTWFSYVCALDEGDDWLRDPKCWIKANPNLGISMPVSTLQEAVNEARNLPSKQNLIARLHFCVWTSAEKAWISAERWLAVEVKPDRSCFKKRKVYLGIDLSKRLDLTAVAFFMPDEVGGGDLFVEFWTPADTLLARADRDKVPYALWRDRGFLHAVPGDSVDFEAVIKSVAKTVKDLELQVISAAFDRHRIDEFKKEMERASVELPLKEFGQGFVSMSPAIDRLENLIVNKRVRIEENPVLRWNAASAVTVEDDAGNRKFSKRKATGRIDGIVAAADAVGVAVLAEPPKPKRYDMFFV